MMQHFFSKQDIYSTGFQKSDSEYELFLSAFSHFAALVATSDGENREVINAVEESHHWRGDIVHYDGKLLFFYKY